MNRLAFALEVLEQEPWLPTPLLQAQVMGNRLGVEIWLKREDCTPVGSFKLRGALVAAASRADQITDTGVYCSTAGNYGLAIATACKRQGIKASIVMPEWANPSKVERMQLLGAEIIKHSDDGDVAKDFAKSIASQNGAPFWEDGVIEEMALGSATIAIELLTHPRPWDYVLVPLGNGSLMKGIATIFKERSPHTKIVGMVPKAMPSMFHFIKGNTWDHNAPVSTIAESLGVRVPIPEITEELKTLVSEVWLIDESKILPAVRSLMDLEQVMCEPASATPIAGIVDHQTELKGKRVAAIITGAHLRLSLIPEIMKIKGLL